MSLDKKVFTVKNSLAYSLKLQQTGFKALALVRLDVCTDDLVGKKIVSNSFICCGFTKWYDVFFSKATIHNAP